MGHAAGSARERASEKSAQKRALLPSGRAAAGRATPGVGNVRWPIVAEQIKPAVDKGARPDCPSPANLMHNGPLSALRCTSSPQMIVNNYTIWWRGSERVPRPNAISTALFNLNTLVLGVYLHSAVAELRFGNFVSRALNQMKTHNWGPCFDLTTLTV